MSCNVIISTYGTYQICRILDDKNQQQLVYGDLNLTYCVRYVHKNNKFHVYYGDADLNFMFLVRFIYHTSILRKVVVALIKAGALIMANTVFKVMF